MNTDKAAGRVIVALLALLAACAAAPVPPVPVVRRPAGVMLCTTATGDGLLYLPFLRYTQDGKSLTVTGSDGETYVVPVRRCYFMDEVVR